MKDFRNLNVWQKAHELTLAVYRCTKDYPPDELYGLRSQTRRAVSSIPTNIAEGCGSDGDAELARFVQIAMGSASETEYHFLLAHDLQYLDLATYNRLNGAVCEVKRMLSSLLQRLRRN